MWIIIKHKKKELNFLKNDISNKLGKDVKFYTPMLRLKFFNRKKIMDYKKPLLGDYIFCFHPTYKTRSYSNSILSDIQNSNYINEKLNI